MNKRLEFVIHLVISSLLGWFIIRWNSAPPGYFIYSLVLWICVGVTQAFSRLIVAPKLNEKQFVYAAVSFIGVLLISFFISAYFYIQYVRDAYKLGEVSLFENIVLQGTVPYLMIGAFFGILFGLRRTVVKKIIYSISAAVLLAGVVFVVKYFIDIRYEGDDKIRFVEKDYATFEDLMQDRRFADKVVYVDLWYSSCSPCIEEFSKLPALKNELAKDNVEYLYLARETSHQNSAQRWKNAIKKYNLEGSHVYMSKELEKNVWELIGKNMPDSSMLEAYPHYMIIDKAKIVSFSADRPQI
jgi:thiol-disulfide isomerase/thioredoxin